MQCVGCELWWHPKCVGLDGLTKYACDLIVQWKCPLCFSFPKEVQEKLGDKSQSVQQDDVPLKAAVREQVVAFMPEVTKEVVAAVKAGVKDALGDNNMKGLVKDVNETITKSWADVAKFDQKRVITEVVQKTSESALQKSMSMISADLNAQRNRAKNCVINNIPEGHGGNDSSLVDVVVSFGNGVVEPGDIVHCKRLGEKKQGRDRIILVVFKKEDQAAEFHNYGRGRHLGNTVWANQDLTRTEREARFQARVERRRRVANRPTSTVRQGQETIVTEQAADAAPAAVGGDGVPAAATVDPNQSNQD